MVADAAISDRPVLVRPGRIRAFTDTLAQEIVAGVHPAGAVLPSEPDLMARFSLSRSVVREGIKMLAAKGLVTVGPRSGTRVQPRESWNLFDREVLGWLAGSQEHGPALWAAIDEMRAIIEPKAAAFAADRADAEDRRAIAAAYQAMVEAARGEDVEAAIAADRAFHLAVLRATDNPALIAFSAAIDALLGALFRVTAGDLSPFRANLDNHRRVLEAIGEKRPEDAEAAMLKIIRFTHQNLRQRRVFQGRKES